MVNKLCRKHSFLQLDRSIRDSVRRTIRQNLSFLLQLEMLLAFIAFILFVFRVSHLVCKIQIFLYFKVHPRYPKISTFHFDVLNMVLQVCQCQNKFITIAKILYLISVKEIEVIAGDILLSKFTFPCFLLLLQSNNCTTIII